MILGYARVSTQKQELDTQRALLVKAGVERVYGEKISGAENDRPQLNAILYNLKRGDVLIVTRLDRIARSLDQLLMILKIITAKGAFFRCLDPDINTDSPTGTLIIHILGAVAEFEKTLINERAREGRERAIEQGVTLGRRKKGTERKIAAVRALLKSKKYTLIEACDQVGISRATYFRNRKQGKK